MSKDFKNLIETVEEENLSKTALEATINSLREEINGLKFTVNEQKLLIEDFRSQLKDESEEKVELPSEIQVLKDMIISQRKDLNRRDNNIEHLNEKIDQLNLILENKKNGEGGHINNDEQISAQRLLVQLTENEELKNEISLLQAQIKGIKKEERFARDFESDDFSIEENEELVNIKKLNFQLMEENGILRVELESKKTQFHESIEKQSSEELKLANDKIGVLTAELEDYEAQVKYLKETLELEQQDLQNIGENQEDFHKLKDELLEYQKQNLVLNDLLTELKEDNEPQESQEDISTSRVYTIPKQIPLSFYSRIYNLLNDQQKKTVQNILIQDLKSEFSEVKRNAIKILSQIKAPRIYDAFSEMIHDKDWIIRLYIVKALSKFKNKRDELIHLMKKLLKDVDFDVREHAGKVLYNIMND
jgi:chromosome segregation ATPase